MNNKPIADRIQDELNAFFRLWREKRWLAILLIIILLIFVFYGIFSWRQRGNTIEDLKSENIELKRDLRQLKAENKSLHETVAPLFHQAAKEFPGEEILESLKKIIARLEFENPIKKPIASAISTVEVKIKSDDEISTHFMGSGGYLAFCRGSDAVLITSSKESNAQQTGNNEVIYSADFKMDATDSVVGKKIEFLQESDYIQINFSAIPNNSIILEGTAIIVINGSLRFEFSIQPQKMQEDKIFIRNIKGFIERNQSKH